MDLHIGPEFPVLDLIRLVFAPQSVQEFIVKLLGGDSLHGQVKIRFVSFQPMVQRELTNAKDLQLLIQNAFTPPLPFVFEETEIQDLSDSRRIVGFVIFD